MATDEPYGTYTPYGSYLDTEPPDPRYLHLACVRELDLKYGNRHWQPLIFVDPRSGHTETTLAGMLDWVSDMEVLRKHYKERT